MNRCTRALLVVGLLSSGCALVQPGEDPSLRFVVRASADGAPMTAHTLRERLRKRAGDENASNQVEAPAPWETVAVIPRGVTPAEAQENGRTYARSSGSLRLDVRMGAGDRGAFMGGVLATGVTRAMVQVRMEDPDAVGCKFRLRIFASGEQGTRDITPTHLRSLFGRGTYRAWVDAEGTGRTFFVEVQTVRRDGEVVAHAFSSLLRVRRPWLQRGR